MFSRSLFVLLYFLFWPLCYSVTVNKVKCSCYSVTINTIKCSCYSATVNKVKRSCYSVTVSKAKSSCDSVTVNNVKRSCSQTVSDYIFIVYFFQQYLSYIRAPSVSGGRSRSTRREPPTMGKQLVIFIGYESSAPFFCNLGEATPYW
jgi:hypothetical protein